MGVCTQQTLVHLYSIRLVRLIDDTDQVLGRTTDQSVQQSAPVNVPVEVPNVRVLC
jgi:hypothetical protein